MTIAVLTRSTLAVACTVLLLTACGGGDKAKPATQAAARVNSGEITVHQINQLLEQRRGLRPEQVEAASRETLERLIDQELAVQQASENKLDREPRVVAALEAARRDILAQAYLERTAESASRPSADEIQTYFNEHPGLFANRRIYSLVEVVVQAEGDVAAEARERANSARSSQEFIDWIKAKGLQWGSNESRQAAEALPLDTVEAMAATPVGKALVTPTPQGLKAVFVMAATPSPVTLDQSRSAIELFISNDRKRALVNAEMKRLRTAAKIEYLGQFAEVAAGAAAAPAPAASPASGLDAATLKKGLGLK